MDSSSQQVSLPSHSDMLKAKTRLAITRVFKSYLTILEDLAEEHDEAMGALHDALPSEQKAMVVLANHFTDTKMDTIRRRVLSTGNDAIRELEELVDSLRLDSTRNG